MSVSQNTATAPYILRAYLMDQEIINNQLIDPATTLITNTLGARVTNRFDQHIAAVSSGAYVFFSMLRGQTLGEELCDTLAVAGRPFQAIGIVRKLILAVLCGAERSSLHWLSRKFLPGQPSEGTVAVVDEVILCLLMLFEAYGTIPHRLSRVRFISLLHPSMLVNGPGRRHQYFIPGLMIALALLIRLYRFYRSRQPASPKGVVNDPTLDSSDSDSDSEGDNVCTVCFRKQRNSTCTPCGHVFCWNCIAESAQKDSRCPLCRQNITLPSLVPLFFYKPKGAERLGSE